MQIAVSSVPMESKNLSQIRSRLEERGFTTDLASESLAIIPSSSAAYLIRSWGTAFILKRIFLRPVEKSLKIVFQFNPALVLGVLAVFAGLIVIAFFDGALKREELPQALLAFVVCLPIMFSIIVISLISSFKSELKG